MILVYEMVQIYSGITNVTAELGDMKEDYRIATQFFEVIGWQFYNCYNYYPNFIAICIFLGSRHCIWTYVVQSFEKNGRNMSNLCFYAQNNK